jgi:hypothetical protein
MHTLGGFIHSKHKEGSVISSGKQVLVICYAFYNLRLEPGAFNGLQEGQVRISRIEYIHEAGAVP